MSVPENKIQFTFLRSGITPKSLDLPKPIYPFSCDITMSLDIQKIYNGTNLSGNGGYCINDNGATYDRRETSFEIIMTQAEHAAFEQYFIASQDIRARNCSIELASGSGFYPFGPDKGDVGIFDIMLFIDSIGEIGERPYKKWRVKMRAVNIGTWPSYSIPADTDVEGALDIGTVENIRMPEQWFKPNIRYATNRILTEANDQYYQDFGINNDQYETSFDVRAGRIKMANLISYLTTQRASAITMVTGTDYYPFGNAAGNGSFSVKTLQNTISVSCEAFNIFRTNLSFWRT